MRERSLWFSPLIDGQNCCHQLTRQRVVAEALAIITLAIITQDVVGRDRRLPGRGRLGLLFDREAAGSAGAVVPALVLPAGDLARGVADTLIFRAVDL
jgi:hypothetical protein